MRILIVTQYFWPEDFRINELTADLVARGHEVTVLTGQPNYPAGKYFKGYGMCKRWKEIYAGAQVLRCPLVPRGKGRGWQLALNYLSFAVSASLLGPFRCRGKFDVIFVFEPSPITVGIPALAMKAFKRAPIYFWLQDLWPESLTATQAVNPNSYLGKLVLRQISRLVKLIYHHSDRILVQSKGFIEQVRSFGISSEKIDYFPNSAEKLYMPLQADLYSLEAKKMPQGFKVMFAGNIGQAQDFESIIAAAEILKEHQGIHWVILGDGRSKAWLTQEIRSRGLERCFHLLGRFPVTEMPKYFSFADAMLVTLRDEPIFALTIPTKIQSYLACAKPVIAGIRGEGAKIIDEAGAGFTCPPRDPHALAAAVLKMYRASEAERDQMGQRGYKYFQECFESQMLLKKLEKLFATEIREKGAS